MRSRRPKCRVRYGNDRLWSLQDKHYTDITPTKYQTMEEALWAAKSYSEEFGTELYVYDELNNLILRKKRF